MDELGDMGVPEDRLEHLRKESEEEQDRADVYVYPVNTDAVRVFIHCRWQRTAIQSPDGTHLFYDGISAQEIESVANAFCIAPERRGQVLEGVRYMEKIALPSLNRE